MRLLFISPFYPPYTVGGAERSASMLAEALATRGHAVRVITMRLGPRAPEGDVPVETVDAGLRLEGAGAPAGARVFDRPGVQLRVARAVARAAPAFDLVHAQSLHLLPAAFAGARRASRPIVATIRDVGGVCPLAVCLLHGPRVPGDCSVLKLQRACVPEFHRVYEIRSRLSLAGSALVGFATARGRSWLLRRCDAVFSVGSDLPPLYDAAGLIDAASVDVLPNIAPAAEKQPNGDGGDYVLYVGKVSVGKGGEQLLEALRLARRRQAGIRLVVAGYAEDRWRRRLESVEGLDYRGWVPKQELAALYARARFAVTPSISPEALPRTALEASAQGVAVIATTAGGIPDVVVDGQTGLLVPPRDAVALADAMVRLWRDEREAARLGTAARARVGRVFSAEAIAGRAEQLYERVLRTTDRVGHTTAADG